jgi:hypothetical protein
MKLRKSDLKDIVRECLVEILREGIDVGKIYRNVPENKSRHVAETHTRQRQTQETISQPLREAIKREAGGNKILESVMADTAATTLPRMIQGEKSAIAGDAVSRFVDSVTPTEIFGEETTSKWADLAFMGMPSKSQE